MTHQSRLACALAIVFATYVASTFATESLVEGLYQVHCVQTFLFSHCDFANDRLVATPAYLVLGAFLCTILAAVWAFGRHTVAFPFVTLIIVLCGAAILFDLVGGRPIIHAPKIINDTLNVLGVVISASFVLLLVIIRKQPYSLWHLMAAVLLSLIIKTVAAGAFLELRIGFYGATELFLLYIVYAFGAFTLHLMTVSGFVASLARAPQRMPA